MRVSNVELHDRQRQIVEELERARQPVRLDVVRILDRDPYGLGGEGLAVERWDAKTKTWSLEDYPPIAGDVELGKVHVVGVFANGRHAVDEERTKKIRVEMARELKLERTRGRERGIDRGMGR